MGVNDHKCRECNAELKFDPKSQKWICEYCGSSYELKDLKKSEKKEVNEEENMKNNSSYNGYHCPDCGAEIVMDENTSVTECVYCGNTAIITERLEGEFSPKELIPFKKNKQDAINAFLNYKKGKWFMPKEFINKNNIDKISGIYIPFYLYDVDVDSTINVEAAKRKVWSDSKYRYTKTDYYDVLREGEMSFSNIPADASKKFPDDIMDSIEPYNFKDLVEFNSSYISGFLSEKYDLSMNDVSNRVEDRAKQTAVDTLLNDVTGYSSKIVTNSRGNVKIKESSKYVLLPVWMLNVKYNQKIYTLAMNGQTGKFIGNVPISWKKVIKIWLGIFVIVTAIIIIINLLNN